MTAPEHLLTVAELRPYFDAAGVTHLDNAYKAYALHQAQRALADKDALIAEQQNLIRALQAAQADDPASASNGANS